MTPAELLERVLAAKGPDREIDLDVFLACGCAQAQPPPFEIVLYPDGSRIPGDRAPVTASLDAAVALVERVRPGWELDISIENGVGTARLISPLQDICTEPAVKKPPALALIAALLRSMT